MTSDDLDRITGWLVRRGLEGVTETALLDGFCRRCGEAGLMLCRGLAIIDTLHPIYEGRAFRWRSDGAEEESVVEYGRTDEGEAAENWRQSSFYQVLASGKDEMRFRLGPDGPADSPQLRAAQLEGQTDCVVFAHRFASEGAIGEMDCVYSRWTTEQPDGFPDADREALRRLVPVLALAMKSASLTHLAGTLVQVYLGREAGRRVLDGGIARGVAERFDAVLWFSDLRGFTTITDSAGADEIIPLLNDYGEVAITAIHENGGDVLKLIGDGILAIFKADHPGAACRSALAAEARLRERIAALNERRAGEGRATTAIYLGLHIGEVLFGNIGSDERLDFTVVGPAVNEVSRIVSMCRSVDRHILISAAFREALPEAERADLVSVGRFALRGVGRAQELFTLDPGLLGPPEIAAPAGAAPLDPVPGSDTRVARDPGGSADEARTDAP